MTIEIIPMALLNFTNDLLFINLSFHRLRFSSAFPSSRFYKTRHFLPLGGTQYAGFRQTAPGDKNYVSARKYPRVTIWKYLRNQGC